MKKYALLLVILSHCAAASQAQVDTVNTNNSILNIAAFKEGKSAYAVFFTDSAGNRTSSADIWDRSISFTNGRNGEKLYRFNWSWYRKDTLIAEVTTTGFLASLKPLSHEADYKKKGKSAYNFENGSVSIPESHRHNARDSAFKVVLDPPAFAFPMDLEILPLLPFKNTGQRFAIAFYEPGSAKAAYYNLAVTGRDILPVPGGALVDCWLLKIDYTPGSVATFWISDRSREVIKMQEYFKGKFRYKVKLY